MNMGFLAAIIAANAAAMKNQRERDEKNRKEKDMQDYKDEAPADMREVRHGKWEIDDDTDGYICRECAYWQPYTTLYCPNCGTRMDGEV